MSSFKENTSWTGGFYVGAELQTKLVTEYAAQYPNSASLTKSRVLFRSGGDNRAIFIIFHNTLVSFGPVAGIDEQTCQA